MRFVKAANEQIISYADYRGNRQYISTGNINSDDRVPLIFMDYANRRRLKLLGRAKIVDPTENPALVTSLHDPSYRAAPERAIAIRVEAFDWK